MSPPIRPSPTASPARVRRLLAGRWPRLFTLVGWAALLAACTAAYGALAGPVLRALFGGGGLTWPAWAAPSLPPPPDLDALRRWLPWILAGVAVLKALAHHRHAVGLAVLGQSIVADLRGRLHARITAMPPDHVALMGAGDLISRATHDVDATEQLVVHGVAAVVRDGLQAAALLAVCVALDPWLALVAFGVYPIAFWPVARFARRLRRAAGDAHHERGALTVELTDQLRRLALIQASGAQGWARRRFAAAVEAVRAAVVRSVRIKAFASPFTEVLGALALAGTLIYATDRIASGDLAAENVIGFFAALMMLYQPIKGLVRAQEVIQPGRAALDRLDALFAMTAALPAGGDDPPPEPIGRLVFDGVEVRRGDRQALAGVDLELRTGESVALVGPNGAGKTTIAWVLARLLDPSAGRVRVDDVDLSSLDPAAWRGRVGWVTQELDLGRGTLRDNVLFGDPPGAAARLDAVAARTGVDALVERLPDGWHTAIGDGGVGLSGGERQRIALARALVRDPAVVVLDEPDAHLDAEAVRTLASLLPDLARDRIVLLITHEPTVADLADRQIRLRAGRVVP